MCMKNILDKIGVKGKLQKNFGAIVILALSGSVIFGLPFFRFDYYDAYLSTYHLTNTQMGAFGTVIGIFGIISYLFGGVVADENHCLFPYRNRNWWTFAFTPTWIYRTSLHLRALGCLYYICILASLCKSSTSHVR